MRLIGLGRPSVRRLRGCACLLVGVLASGRTSVAQGSPLLAKGAMVDGAAGGLGVPGEEGDAVVSGTVHDPQHRPLGGAEVVLTAALGGARRVLTTPDGEFRFRGVAAGGYTVRVRHDGFRPVEERVAVGPGEMPALHFALEVAGATETVTVTGASEPVSAEAVTPTVMLDARAIEALPGAALSNSLAMITDYVPGAYITHDMLHIRGGHQVSWLLDGVQIPNTNIASNLGAQVDPRDIASLEVDRGSYGAGLGDRTYGVFDVNPKSGFERSREGELLLTAGSARMTDDQVSVGDHSQRAAYYVSLNGRRSDYGLAPPVERGVHNAENGFGGFTSLLFNRSAQTQFRLLAQGRADHFQIPYDPDPASYTNQLYDSSGLRDVQDETDEVVAFTATHRTGLADGHGVQVTVSPFFHGNRASYTPGAGDTPTATTSDRVSRYGGVQASVAGEVARNRLQGGFYSWGQRDRQLFGVRFADGSGTDFAERDTANGGLVEEYVEDSFAPTTFLTLTAGFRASAFWGGGVQETAVMPRFGAAVRVPRLHWVFRAFYGHFYQPPPLVTVSGPVLGYAAANNTTFAPLRGERDEEHQFGVQIPFRGWVLDADTFETRASNLLDHSNIGESSLYFPVTVEGALIQAWEVTVRSPLVWRRVGVHLAYSNQIAKQRGALTGGLICTTVSSPECDAGPGYEPLDHDQRNTLSVGGEAQLPAGVGAAVNVAYGSGFVNGYPDPPSPFSGEYLPGHTTVDVRLSRGFGERLRVGVNATNVANQRRLLDNSLTFGGFHQNDPRQVYGEVRYRFRW